MSESYNPTNKSVVWALPRSLATTKGISIDFSTLATKMFQFARCPPIKAIQHYLDKVALFGNLRVKDCSHLAEAYRSWPRPSSEFIVKASTICFE
jgi:hypothetical protein